MTGIITRIELDDHIKMLTNGEHGADDVLFARVNEVEAGDSRDGYPYWEVCVNVAFMHRMTEKVAIKRFNHSAKAAAQSYAYDCADALGVSVI